MAALYMLFCGDVLRYAADNSMRTFSVPLLDWYAAMRGYNNHPIAAEAPINSKQGESKQDECKEFGSTEDESNKDEPKQPFMTSKSKQDELMTKHDNSINKDRLSMEVQSMEIESIDKPVPRNADS
jgi:hypothetical protein